MKKPVFILVLAIMAYGCNSSRTRQAAENAASEGSAMEKATAEWSLVEIWRTDTVLNTCESVLYDSASQTLFVSCINGAPDEKNGSGFIALVNTDGTVRDLEWVTGLNAPKGMGLYKGKLYVTDIDRLAIIDVGSAKIDKFVPVPGASFLNDISIDKDGTVYFSDSDTGWLWTYSGEGPEPWITEGLDRPNGLYVEDSRVLLTSSGSSDLKIIDKSDKTMESVTQEIGYGDGLVYTGMDGYYIVSSWSGEVFLVLPDFSKISLLKTSDEDINSADIGFNPAEQILYVPTFFDNRVVAYHLVKGAAGEQADE